MYSPTELCNLALLEAGINETLQSLDEESVSARMCRRIYDVTKKEVLSMYKWSFALKYANLSKLSITQDGFSGVFSYPSDCLRIIKVYNSSGDFSSKNSRVETDNITTVGFVDSSVGILCNYETPFAEYISDVPETSFSPLFSRFFYLNLAQKLSLLSGSPSSVLTTLSNNINISYRMLMLNDSGQQDNSFSYDDSYINARG